jgi:hypothetical protein
MNSRCISRCKIATKKGYLCSNNTVKHDASGKAWCVVDKKQPIFSKIVSRPNYHTYYGNWDYVENKDERKCYTANNDLINCSSDSLSRNNGKGRIIGASIGAFFIKLIMDIYSTKRTKLLPPSDAVRNSFKNMLRNAGADSELKDEITKLMGEFENELQDASSIEDEKTIFGKTFKKMLRVEKREIEKLDPSGVKTIAIDFVVNAADNIIYDLLTGANIRQSGSELFLSIKQAETSIERYSSHGTAKAALDNPQRAITNRATLTDLYVHILTGLDEEGNSWIQLEGTPWLEGKNFGEAVQILGNMAVTKPAKFIEFVGIGYQHSVDATVYGIIKDNIGPVGVSKHNDANVKVLSPGSRLVFGKRGSPQRNQTRKLLHSQQLIRPRNINNPLMIGGPNYGNAAGLGAAASAAFLTGALLSRKGRTVQSVKHKSRRAKSRSRSKSASRTKSSSEADKYFNPYELFGKSPSEIKRMVQKVKIENRGIALRQLSHR